jgi:hypothetical protein
MSSQIILQLSNSQLDHIKSLIDKTAKTSWEEEIQTSFSLEVNFWELGPTLVFKGYNTVEIGEIEVKI